MAENAQRQLHPLRHQQQQQLQSQSVQRQPMAIPSGLPNRPSTYFGNANYYVQQQAVRSQQQQNQLQQQQQLQSQQQQRYMVSGSGGMRAVCASNAATNPY